jgi:hypothetical protein
MRMVVLTAREAPPNQKRDLPLHLMRSWPIGQRVRLRWVDGVPQIDEGAQIIPPFVRPKTEDELDKPRYKYRRISPSTSPRLRRA